MYCTKFVLWFWHWRKLDGGKTEGRRVLTKLGIFFELFSVFPWVRFENNNDKVMSIKKGETILRAKSPKVFLLVFFENGILEKSETLTLSWLLYLMMRNEGEEEAAAAITMPKLSDDTFSCYWIRSHLEMIGFFFPVNASSIAAALPLDNCFLLAIIPWSRLSLSILLFLSRVSRNKSVSRIVEKKNLLWAGELESIVTKNELQLAFFIMQMDIWSFLQLIQFDLNSYVFRNF